MNKTTEQPTLHIPEELQDQAKEFVKDAFRLFADHNRKLAQDLSDFEKQKKETQERIKRGARRTSGRIV
ncbi:hypothetical protein CCAX7_000740 [Capsulimonas corticalis]|uniref:Uncharacterized protein n=1 Tax=Capsulimonas corticalis TaxID=2219043 RepID=A0A402CRD9_9BACT|nr:hypothetical protein [Capsulimonas corticalis]BDI28023.1 hypothetical protein CCAX7_000740 [Capsulimonas corticalis]